MTISSYTGWAKEGLFHVPTRTDPRMTVPNSSLRKYLWNFPKMIGITYMYLNVQQKNQRLCQPCAAEIFMRNWDFYIHLYILTQNAKDPFGVRILCTIRDYEFSGRSFYWKWAKTRTVGKLCRQRTPIFIKYRCFPGASKNPEETS